MAALTSAGPWPIPDSAFVTYAALLPVYGRVTPRLALSLSPAATAATGAGSSSGSSTTVPAVPVFTRFPVTP
jgi:hypothetical protein